MRQLVNQNLRGLSILSIHVADRNIRVHLERAQGEKGQNLKRTARSNLFILLEDALDRVFNRSNNQSFLWLELETNLQTDAVCMQVHNAVKGALLCYS